MFRSLLFLWFFAGCVICVHAADEVRAFYMPTFTYGGSGTTSKLSEMIDKALAHRFNQIYIQVRSRADAYYYPNRDDATYPNPEPRTQRFSVSPADLDVLQYTIEQARARAQAQGRTLQVHAWITTFNSWDVETPPASPAHVYNAHPDWITETYAGRTLTYEQDAFLDPGVPAVQSHLFNLCLDLVRNYDIDGLHFDYIRLVQADSGYDPVAVGRFDRETGWDFYGVPGLSGVYRAWRRQQITELVRRVYIQTKQEKPWVNISAFLVDFTDSVQNLAQGYNQWSRFGLIDTLLPGQYSDNYATIKATLNRVVGYTRPAGASLPARPIVMALGAEDAWSNDPAEMTSTVSALRAETPAPAGVCFFAYRGLAQNNDTRFRALSDSGSVFATPAAVPDLPHLPADRIPPGAPRSMVASTAIPARVQVSFAASLSATDGDVPVQYRIYRDRDSVVDETYANLRMVFWEKDGTRQTFLWSDRQVTVGVPYWYKIVAYDDWFNASVPVTVGPVVPQSGTGTTEIVIDNGDAGFSTTGSWVASGGEGAYNGNEVWALSGGTPATARWLPTITLAGDYEVSIWYRATTNRADNAPFQVTHAQGATTIRVNQQINGGRWVVLGIFPFGVGTSGFVELSDDANPTVVVADAVRFRWTGGGETDGWEPKPLLASWPAPTLRPGEAVIVDNTPRFLQYDDEDNVWLTTTTGNNVGGDARYLRPPSSSKACWVAHLPVSGTYTIDAYLRNSTFCQRAFYRFVDGHGQTVIRGPVSQRLRGEGFVAQVSAPEGHFFLAGPVYVTIYTDATSTDVLIADALRFVLVSAVGTSTMVDLY